MLQNVINSLGQGTTSATGGQQSAINQIENEASGAPSYAAPGEATVSNLFNTSTAPQQGLLTNTLNTTNAALAPELSSTFTNPLTTPGFGAALSTLNNDITNQVDSQFAGAGRSGSPDNAQALARGLSQGEGQLIANEANTLTGEQQAAAGQTNNATINTTGALTGQQEVPLTNALQGISAAGSIPGLLTQPGTTALGAQTLGATSPYLNASSIENLINPIAALGGQTSGVSGGTSTTATNPLSNIIGGVAGTAGLIGGTQGFGANGWLTSLLSSDKRLKKDIHKVGELPDSTPVHTFKWKGGDDKKHIGFIAQEVEKHHPDAVHNVGGIKRVEYGKVLARGMLSNAMNRAT